MSHTMNVLTSQSGTDPAALHRWKCRNYHYWVAPAAAVLIQCDEQSNDPSSGISLL